MTKEDEKITNYSPVAREIRKLHWVLTKIVLLVVVCLGVFVWLVQGFCERSLGIPGLLGGTQGSAVIGTTLILRGLLVSIPQARGQG